MSICLVSMSVTSGFVCRTRSSNTTDWNETQRIWGVAIGPLTRFHTAGFEKMKFPLSQMVNLPDFIQRDSRK